ncbi:nitrous oxide reductase family maturation protein NosD [Candidatus Magnetominusculus xianensis]|uniref:Copper ABC transporter substrate-binding protein n=1 Tax=Candidatus Magnetominusculus xianensis TaxID=1748249 RepID=A0ABR5SCF4_9BACT|nr:nitrous oxide reductase family maturation protein NosD [Candidatus Magnetominusculus xianensis]KWT76420.1 copper ABC transporter substrate-binding protein [Candidatus Magnetominusculus xianensis]MBF0404889.1 nitrous oxide reductase family maturation protein NosD [Nitrospirota bacterium]
MNELAEAPLWKLIWVQKALSLSIFAVFLVLIFAVIAFNGRLSRHRRLLNIIRYAALTTAFIYVGLALKAQPSTTNVIIALNSFKEGDFPLELFMMDPFIFLSFVFIMITAVLWGRGVFCGWLCPFGAIADLFNRLFAKAAPKVCYKKIPQKIHNSALYLKYVILAAIVGVSFYNFMLGEYMTEVEPFKTLVLKLNRPWYFLLYFFALLIVSALVTRAFCQYVCPLGSAIALPSFFKWLPVIKLKRYARCSSCRICRNDCVYQAIDDSGRIMDTVCMYCLECQMNYHDAGRCPELLSRKNTGVQPSTAAAAIAVFVLLIPTYALSATLVVDAGAAGSSSISEALNKAKDGDVIEVRPGRYKESFKVTKSVHMKGINNPVILAASDFPIIIDTSEVQFEGFTIEFEGNGFSPDSTALVVTKASDNVTVKNNTMVNIMFGIRNLEGINLRIDNNTFTGNKSIEENDRGNCVTLTGSWQATITNNKMSYCRDAIYMEVCHDSAVTYNDISKSRYAIHTMWVDTGNFSYNNIYDNLVGMAIMYTKHSKINGNLSVGNKTHGLLLNQTVRSEISGNNIISNTKGIFIYNSIENKMTSNLIMNNNMGVHNWGGSEENTITHNSFINNEVQVKFVASKNQYWSNNYWSDYLGWDMAGKGVGDIPYESNTVVDHMFWRYPLSKLLFASPALHMLKVLEKQFPILQVPKVVDKNPSMVPYHANWKELISKYAQYVPAKYYGDMEKIINMTGNM